MNQDNKDLEATIIAEWKVFANTSAYKDWVKSMDQTIEMIQENVDNMTERRPVGEGKFDLATIDAEKASLINQRKVGIKYALQYPKLRIDA